jgi:hypothetical protein
MSQFRLQLGKTGGEERLFLILRNVEKFVYPNGTPRPGCQIFQVEQKVVAGISGQQTILLTTPV